MTIPVLIKTYRAKFTVRPKAKRRAKPRAAREGGPQTVDHNKTNERKQPRAARKAPLLSPEGENKVCLLLWQEVQAGLRALPKPLAPESAGAYGDLGLRDVIARAQGVRTGVEKSQNPGALVVM
jgi:hypothetical protein